MKIKKLDNFLAPVYWLYAIIWCPISLTAFFYRDLGKIKSAALFSILMICFIAFRIYKKCELRQTWEKLTYNATGPFIAYFKYNEGFNISIYVTDKEIPTLPKVKTLTSQLSKIPVKYRFDHLLRSLEKSKKI